MRWKLFLAATVGFLLGVAGQDASMQVVDLVHDDYVITVNDATSGSRGGVFVCGVAKADGTERAFVGRLSADRRSYEYVQTVGNPGSRASKLLASAAETFVYAVVNQDDEWFPLRIASNGKELSQASPLKGEALSMALDTKQQGLIVGGKLLSKGFRGSDAGYFIAAFTYTAETLNLRDGMQNGFSGDAATHLAASPSNSGVYALVKPPENEAPPIVKFFELSSSYAINEQMSEAKTVRGAREYSTSGFQVDSNENLHAFLEVRESAEAKRKMVDVVVSSILQTVGMVTICCDLDTIDSDLRTVQFGSDSNFYLSSALSGDTSGPATYRNQLNVISQFGVQVASRDLNGGGSRRRFVGSAYSKGDDTLLFFANNVNSQVDITTLSPIVIEPARDPVDTPVRIRVTQEISNPARKPVRDVVKHVNSILVYELGVMGNGRLSSNFSDTNLGTVIKSEVVFEDYSGDTATTLDTVKDVYRSDVFERYVNVIAKLEGVESITGVQVTPTPTPAPTASGPPGNGQQQEDDEQKAPSGEEEFFKEPVKIHPGIIVGAAAAGILLIVAVLVLCIRLRRARARADRKQAPAPVAPIYVQPVPVSNMGMPHNYSGASQTIRQSGRFGQQVDTGFIQQ